MAFKFEFQRTSGPAPAENVKEAIKASLRDLSKKLKKLGTSISLQATIDARDE